MEGVYPLSIEEWARSPTPVFGHDTVKLIQPYERWLDENLDHAFVQTIDPNNPSSRELYDAKRAPGLNMWQIFTPLFETTKNFCVIGTLVIRTHYEFRGTRTNTDLAQAIPSATKVYATSDPQSLVRQPTMNSVYSMSDNMLNSKPSSMVTARQPVCGQNMK